MTTGVEVLVVDDDLGMAGTIVEILALNGVAGEAVATGAAAITHMGELRPAVVVCDQRLPDMTGLELCPVLRAIDPDVSLILLTGHASLDSAIAAVGQVDAYLMKPVTPDELVRSVAAGIVSSARHRAERREIQEVATRLAAIVESTDDAVIAKSLTGIITAWNGGAERLYGYRAEEVIGRPVSILGPPESPDHSEIVARIQAGEHVEHFQTVRIRRDGTRLNVSLTESPIHDDTGRIVGTSSIARDITDRLAAEGLRRDLDSAAARQRQALEINDAIVQHLVVAQTRLDLGDVAGGMAALAKSMVHGRRLIDDLLAIAPLGPAPAAARAGGPPAGVPPWLPDGPTEATRPAARHREQDGCTVVIADDSDDVRQLVRRLLIRGGFTVADEARDGLAAVAVVQLHQPDLVLLDHAMPNLDGLHALPLILAASPHSTVVMLSGFSADRLAQSAVDNGAAAYITKTDLTTTLVPELRRIMRLREAE